ncbi:hypothetical protein [Streptomyces sp. NPDC050504]|uniref:hypothetical protein n=1 Tax=Streptomyces sp. NPDC050504 TaxID=3365618 RepID=UPI0037B57533
MTHPMGPYFGPGSKEHAEAQAAQAAWIKKQLELTANDVVTKLKDAWANASRAGAEMTGLKGEAIGGQIGIKGAETNFRLYGRDFNLNEFIAERREQKRLKSEGLTPEQLKNSITQTQKSLSRTIRNVGAASRAARAARTSASEAKALARTADTKAERALSRQASAAQRGGQGSRTGQGTADVRNIDQASQAIDRLERRINRLAAELG